MDLQIMQTSQQIFRFYVAFIADMDLIMRILYFSWYSYHSI